jgi:ubiquinone/menaquinone biosynthesis C-methylase UbiE
MKNTKFIKPEQVLFRLGIERGATVVDMGAGSGHFAISASKMVSDNGKVYVIDILESALDHINAEARLHNLKNILTIQADLEKGTTDKVPDGSADLVVIANVLHQLKNSKNIFTESYRVLKTGGKLLVVDWNDNISPIGPKSDERVLEDQVKKDALKANLKHLSNVETDSYHYGLIFTK